MASRSVVTAEPVRTAIGAPLRQLRPFDFSGRRLPPGRADRFQASVRNGRSCAGLPYRLWQQLRHGLRASRAAL